MRRIAIMDAYRYFSERIDTIYVSSNSTVKNLRDLDDTVNAKVKTAMRSMTVISVNRASDGFFMRLFACTSMAVQILWQVLS